MFSQISPVSPTTMLDHPTTKVKASLASVIKRQQDQYREVREAMEAIHRVYEEKSAKKRDKRYEPINDKKQLQQRRFDIDDYVLVEEVITILLCTLFAPIKNQLQRWDTRAEQLYIIPWLEDRVMG